MCNSNVTLPPDRIVKPIVADLEHLHPPMWDEGWGLFDLDDGTREIQRIDELMIFPTDRAAVRYVKKRAKQGSQPHIDALVAVITSRVTR